MRLNILILLSGIFAFSCSSVKMDTAETATKLVEFSKSPCFGTCPSYNVIVYTDGSVEYTGKRHVERKGIFKKQLTESEYKALYVALKKENMYQYEDAYNADIMDGSKTRIIYYGEKGKKVFSTLYTFPGNTQAISDQFADLAMSTEGWESMNKYEAEETDFKTDNPIRKVLSYSQGSCFGECPVFTIDVFSDGRMLLTGKAFTSKKGIYEKYLKGEELKEVLALVEAPAFKTLDTKDDKRVMDAQTFEILYIPEKGSRVEKVWKINDAEVLEQLKSFFQGQEEGRSWKAKGGKKESKEEEMKNTIIVSLSPKVDAKEWIKTKRHLKARIVRFLSPNGTYILMSFDPELDPNRVKEELRRDRNVIEVQNTGRPATPRSTQTGKSGKKGTATIRGNNK